MKRQLDSMINFQKKSQGGFSEEGRNFAKGIRSTINNTLRELDSEYAAVNDRLSSSITALEDFDKVTGIKTSIYADNASEAIGQELRKLLSNYGVRSEQAEAIAQLNDVASKLGGKFNTDLYDLVNFGKMLDDNIKPVSARGSLQAELQTATSNAVNAGLDAVTGNNVGLARSALNKGADYVNKRRGIDDDNQYLAIQQLLKGR